MLPLKIGAALTLASLPTYRDWLIEGERDLEIAGLPDIAVVFSDWSGHAQVIRPSHS